MNLKARLTPELGFIGPDTPLVEAAKAMWMSGVATLLVGERDRLVGAVTDRDITVRAVAEGLDPKTVPVRRIMTRAPQGDRSALRGWACLDWIHRIMDRTPYGEDGPLDGGAGAENRASAFAKRPLLNFPPYGGGASTTQWAMSARTNNKQTKRQANV